MTAATRVERTLMADHMEFTTGYVYTATFKGEEIEDREQKSEKTANNWEGGKQWEDTEDNSDKSKCGGDNEVTATETQ